MSTPAHPQADILKAYAEDKGVAIWCWKMKISDENQNAWIPVAAIHLFHEPDLQYAVGPKPSAPPRLMCVLAGIEFPKPESEIPKIDSRYWVASMNGVTRDSWDSTRAELENLRLGLIHLDEAAAELHSQALRAANAAAILHAK